MSGTTRYYMITCPIKWPKLFEGEQDMGRPGTRVDFTKFQGVFMVDAVLSEDQKNQLIEWGVDEVVLGHNQFKIDKDGDMYYRFKRKNFVPAGNFTNGPPEVFDLKAAEEAAAAEGSENNIRPYIKPWTGGKIGNGSTCAIKFEIWEKEGAKVVTLVSVGVKDHVKYEGGDDGLPDDDIPF